MLMQLCHHARNNPAAPKAVARFLEAVGGGEDVWPNRESEFEGPKQSPSPQPWREWARDIARLLIAEMQEWDYSALLVCHALLIFVSSRSSLLL